MANNEPAGSAGMRMTRAENPSRAAMATAQNAHAKSYTAASRHVPLYSFIRQNTTTVVGARIAVIASAVGRTDDRDQLSVFSITAPNAPMATITRSTSTTNID